MTCVFVGEGGGERAREGEMCDTRIFLSNFAMQYRSAETGREGEGNTGESN